MIEILDAECPEKTYNNVRRKNHWMSATLFELMRDRDSKYKLARKTNKDEDWEAARLSRNRTNEACKQAKNDFVN